MTALTAIFGRLPAALSTRIGAQTQRPLAIVVVGRMIVGGMRTAPAQHVARIPEASPAISPPWPKKEALGSEDYGQPPPGPAAKEVVPALAKALRDKDPAYRVNLASTLDMI
jgi:hypothetical protein